jgi:carboxyl-terminal processing protease
MVTRKIAVPLAALGALFLFATGAASDGPSPHLQPRVAEPPRDQGNTAAAEFADQLLDVIRAFADAHIKAPERDDLVVWAVRSLWRSCGKPLPADLNSWLGKVRGMPQARLRALLADIRGRLGDRPELAEMRDVGIAIAGIIRRLEPESGDGPAWQPPDTAIICYRYSPVGIGVKLRPRSSGQFPEVMTPILDSPAYKAGIKAGDAIAKITCETDRDRVGQPLQEPLVIPTAGLSAAEVAEQLRGKAGTKVKLTIRRPGAAKEVTIEVTRAPEREETVLGARRTANDQWDYLIRGEPRLAYVRLTRFSRTTLPDLDKVLSQLARVGVKGLVLDLRFNPGGLVDCAVKISDLLVDDGTLVTIRSRAGPEVAYVGRGDGSYTAFPMACLVNGHSKRAAEFVAASLQDHGRAVVVGERSAGSAGISTLMPLQAGGHLRVTTAVFCRADGRNLNKFLTSGGDDEQWGVRPNKGLDRALPPEERAALQEHLDRLEIIPRRDAQARHAPPFRDRQLELALAYLRKLAKRAG